MVSLFATAAQAQVQLSIPDSSAVEGDTLLIPVRVDSSLTGLNVLSYTVELIYTDAYLEPLSVETSSSLSSGMSVVANLDQSGRMTIAGAGATALSGTGDLFYIRAVITNSFGFTISFDASQSQLNEGSPSLIFDNGSLSVSPKPTINVNAPSNLRLGETAFATVSGQVDPMTWTSLDPSIATINDSTGLVTIVGAGNFRIVGEDSRGIRDTSTVRYAFGYLISGTDSTNFSGQVVSNQVTITDVTALNVKAGEFRLNSGSWTNRLELISLTKGSLLDPGATLTYNATDNYIDVAFAQTSDITGSGDLIQLEFRLKDGVTGSTWFTPQNMVLNDDILGLASAFSVTANALPALTISPGSVTNPLSGDSTQFSVSNQTGPVTWSLSDSSLATVDSTGKVNYTRGGTLQVIATDSIGATGQTSNINIFDLITVAPDTSTLVIDTLMYPIRVENIPGSGADVLSMEFEFNYNESQLDYLGFSTSGSLTDGWSFVENDLTSGNSGKIKFVGASATAVASDGDLIYIQLAADASVSTDLNASVSITNLNYNEGSPNSLIDNGNIFLSTKPLTPSLVSPASNSQQQDTSLVLDWDVAVGADSYEIQLSTNNSFTANLVDTTGVVPDSLPVSGLDFFTLYYWRVRAVNTGGESNWSSAFNFRTKEPLPLPPTLGNLPDSLVGAPLKPTFTWGPAPSFTDNYTFQLDTSETFASPLIDSTFFSSFFNTPDSLEIGTDYYWRIRSNGQSGAGPFSPTRTFRTEIPAPQQPTLLSPADGAADQDTSLTLDWTAPQFADTYQVQLSTVSNFSSGLVIDTTGYAPDSILATGLTFGTRYYWRVTAEGEGGNSSWSSTFFFDTKETIPLVVTLLSPADSAATIVNPILSWNASSFADNYRVEVDTANTFATPLVDSTLTGTSIQLDHLEFDKQYFWRVFASNELGENAGSETRTFFTNPTIPDVPVPTSPADGATDVVLTPTLNWNPASFADTYTVQLSLDSTFTAVFFDSTQAGTSLTLDSLTAVTTYYWRVLASNGVGNSAFSTVFDFTTGESIPPVVILDSPADGATVAVNPVLSWNASTFADSYRLELASDPAYTAILLDSALTATSVQLDSLAFTTTYYWRVYASNEKGESGASESRSFITSELNTPPVVANPLGSINVNEDFTTFLAANLNTTFTDAQGGLSYSIVSFDSTLITAALTGAAVQLSSVLNQFGVAKVVVKASDPLGLEASDTLTVNINPVNDIPVIGVVPDTLKLSTTQPLVFAFDSIAVDLEDLLADFTFEFSVSPPSINISADLVNYELTISSPTFIGVGSLFAKVKDSDGDSLEITIPIEVSLGTSNEDITTALPTDFELKQNYPNPFNPTTNISFGIPQASQVRLSVYNLLGQEVKVLVNERRTAGWHEVTFDATNLSSGIYIMRIVSGSFVESRKMMLIK